MATKKTGTEERLETGVRNLDELTGGGFPKGSVTIFGGAPGTGKTILAQKICFQRASADERVLYFNTLSEPTAKTLRHLSQFSFFDPDKLEAGIQFVDLGVIVQADDLSRASELIMSHVKRVEPSIVVIDSFKVFDDLASTADAFRKFSYELAINLMAWEATTFLLGEYGPEELSTNPLFSIVDALVVLSQREVSSEHQRFIQLVKMRGTDHSRNEHPFVITSNGVEVFAPRITIKREDRGPGAERCQTGISKLDDLLGQGIPRGSSLLVSGVAGTGKTALLLEFLYRGAQAGEKGIVFSFEETAERLRAAARGMGWDLDEQLEREMVEIVFIPQPDIMVEAHMQMMQELCEKTQAKRVAIDSVSVFLHKVTDPQVVREKIFQLASIVQNTQAVGLFAADIPYGSEKLSRFGVEETVVDGVILLSSTEEAFERQRYLEIYKLRSTAHLNGRHEFAIGSGGITVFPRYDAKVPQLPASAPEGARPIPSGVPRLDELCGGGLLRTSVTLVSGSAGIGKSTLARQFLVEGATHDEPGLYIALEEEPAQILRHTERLGLPLKQANDDGLVELFYLPRARARPGRFLTILEDMIREQNTRRLVLDSVGQLTNASADPEALRQLLYSIAMRCKSLGVTCLFTAEADSMYSTDTVTERGYSAIADNIVMLRYAKLAGHHRSTISVVKTRGSAHDHGTYAFSIGAGGMQIGEPVERGFATPERSAGPPASRPPSPAEPRGS